MMFKDGDRHRAEWWDVHPKLRLILCDADLWCMDHGINMIVTELLRSEEQQRYLFSRGEAKSPTSVHQFGRGADIRKFVDPGHIEQLAEYINRKYPYDPNRPALKTLLWHDGSSYHGHFQVTE